MTALRAVDSLPVRVRSKIDVTADCWIWTGSKNALGYGRLSDGHGTQAKAHRYVYELLVGPIPEGLELDHLCVTPSCVNPAHLEPVTHAENMRRYGDRLTECKRGHPRTPENLVVRTRADGSTDRRCRPCQRIVWRQWKARADLSTAESSVA